MAIERKQLIAAAKELNELLELDPKIKTVAVKTDELEGKIKETAKLFEEGDEISADLKSVFDGLEVEIPDFVKVQGAGEAEEEAEEEVKPDTVTIDGLSSLAGEMNTIMGLEPEIDVDLEFDDLKAAILENCYDDGECQIFDTDEFSADALSTLAVLGVTPVVTIVKPEKDKKEDAKKSGGKKSGGKKSETKKSEKKTEAEKTEEKKPANKAPGVIATIITTIKEKGPITKDGILAELKKAFPNREEKAMKATINVQVPGRINKERNFQIVDNGSGWQVKV